MSNEHAPTGGEGVETGDAPGVADDRTMTSGDLDDLFEVLADERRRRVLAYLADADDGVASFPDLVDHVADAAGESAADEQVAVSLHHGHLPKLAEADVVEYDPRSETVRYRGGPAVADWLDLARSHSSSDLDP